MAVTQSLTLTQQSQSIVNNYSVVKMLWQSTQSGESYNNYNRTAYYWVSINGGAETKYSVSYKLPKRSTATIVDVDIVVPHTSDGAGSISVRTWMDTKISAGEVTKTASLTLPTIPRMTTMTTSGGELGTDQLLNFTKQHSEFTHSVSYKCGTESGTICTKAAARAISWKPPVKLAYQNTTGENVTVTFTVSTYNGDALIGTTTATATYHIPAEYAPYFNVHSSDEKGYLDKYQAYVQGQSRYHVQIEPNTSYGAWITGCTASIDGKTYTLKAVEASSPTTYEASIGTLINSGKIPVTFAVTDSRGRTTKETIEIDVLTYQYPKITDLTAVRCDQDGRPNPIGDYLLVTFSSETFALNNKNSCVYTIEYKKASDTKYTEWSLNQWKGQYLLYGGYDIIPADVMASYDVFLYVKDDFNTAKQKTIGASGRMLWDLLKENGNVVGAAVGKAAELSDVLDIGFQTRFTGGVLHSVLPADTDVNTLLAPTTYMLLSANQYINLPEAANSVGAFMEIVGIKDGSLIQRLSIFDRSNPMAFERIHYSTTGWGDWLCVRGDFVIEEGTENDWTYRKWASGIAECWKTIAHSTAITTAWGALYHGTATTRQVYPPNLFIGKPHEQAALTAGSYQAILFPEKDGNGVNGASASACYNVCRPSAITSTMEFYICISVKGRWK